MSPACVDLRECLWGVAYENGEAFIGDADYVEAAAGARRAGTALSITTRLRRTGPTAGLIDRASNGINDGRDHVEAYQIHDLLTIWSTSKDAN